MLLIFVKPSNFDAIILDFWISWGSVTTQLRWDGGPCNSYIESFPMNLTVKEFGKLAYICQSYDQKSSVLFCDLTHTVIKPYLSVCVCSMFLVHIHSF